ncbi:hypothetical protein H8E06_00245 [bacterium]|nr:hypothetical protein [bacterium]
MSSSESDDNGAEIAEINDQLKVYYKCTDFYEEELQTLYVQYMQAKKFKRNGAAATVRKKLVETVSRYNHLVREGKEYLKRIKIWYPEIFDTNIDEFRVRDGWYDEFIDTSFDDDDTDD